MTRAYLGLGSNLGDRRATLRAAAEALDWGDTRVVGRSSLYETTPVGGPPDQPIFLNQVLAVDTALDALGLFERCQAVEAALGRDRMFEERWGPRVVDVDLLVFGEAQVKEPDLEVPHPRLAERAFVLVPLAELAPELDVPGLGPVGNLLAALPTLDGVRKL